MSRELAVIVDYLNIIKVIKNPNPNAGTTGYKMKKIKKI